MKIQYSGTDLEEIKEHLDMLGMRGGSYPVVAIEGDIYAKAIDPHTGGEAVVKSLRRNGLTGCSRN